ncbi:HAD family hydrolase [Leptolyngbya iicbica]|uniref:HAD family phosphatase n=2 Tax=Cyanophyceae TaxID=3028117 RepID=A0A4Q7EHX8_9CYAN|nr:HAD family hydrolase [Leptolyngbya sp. LK]RZM82648.1 HAD family phosphatase [Leptolyngbya sp. LK]
MKKSPVLWQESSWSQLQRVQLVASDMDGTLTRQGQFTPDLLQALTTLADLSVATLIVTGRSAGWVQAVTHYLPVVGAIAENGGVFIAPQTGATELLVEVPAIAQHRQQLATMFAQLQGEFPDLTPAVDNPFRLTDWTFAVGDLSPAALDCIAATCRQAGWGFTYSTVQCHIRPQQQDKGVGLQRVLQQHFPHIALTDVVTVGDSPNDEGLFDGNLFPLSVGVANVQHYVDRLQHRPTLITPSAEVAGFQELVAAIAQAKGGEW